jgi:acetyltransferase-like isoleucine patch superfamily enzyme
MELADAAIIYYGSEMRAPYRIKIGKGTIIGDKAILDGRNGIQIGEHVNFSSHVAIWTEQHNHRDPYFRCNIKKCPVVIHNRVWIGPNVTILPNVEIGEGAVVAAGSVVTKSIEPFAIVAGVPAKKIGERNKDLKYEFDGKYVPFL